MSWVGRLVERRGHRVHHPLPVGSRGGVDQVQAEQSHDPLGPRVRERGDAGGQGIEALVRLQPPEVGQPRAEQLLLPLTKSPAAPPSSRDPCITSRAQLRVYMSRSLGS
jgi:hypothetical protein